MCGGGVIPFIVLFIHWMLWLAYFPMLLDFDCIPFLFLSISIMLLFMDWLRLIESFIKHLYPCQGV